MFTRLLGVGVVAGILMSPCVAFADLGPAKVIVVQNAPVAVTRCTTESKGGVYWAELVNITNRSPHPLLSADVRFQYFDDEGPVGQDVITLKPQNSDVLASQDSETAGPSSGSWGQISAPASTIRYATCRIMSAEFTRGRKWTYGQPYAEKLMPLAADHAMTPTPPDSSSRGAVSVSTQSPVTVTIAGTWVSTPPAGGTYVHVRAKLASARSISVSPGQFRVSMALANGATKEYAVLAQPAPQVLRGGLLTYTGSPSDLQPSIASAEDFGAVGQITLQANVPVTIVLTFPADLSGGTATVQKVSFGQ